MDERTWLCNGSGHASGVAVSMKAEEADDKVVVPGEGYRRAAASVAAHANWRQAEVAKGYARKARECDAAVPGDDTPFTDLSLIHI